jgi:hypothetical protein
MSLISEIVAIPVATHGLKGDKVMNETNGLNEINGLNGAVYTASKKVAPISDFAAPTKPNGVPKALADSISATKAEYRQVGRSGLRVSNPIVGTLGMGDSRWMDWIMEESEVSRLITYCVHLFQAECASRRPDYCMRHTVKVSTHGTRPMHTPTGCRKPPSGGRSRSIISRVESSSS